MYLDSVSDAATLAIDLGGTNVRAAVTDSEGRIIHRDRIRTPSGQAIPYKIGELARRVIAQSQRTVQQAVIGLPGIVDHDREQLAFAPNIPQHWIDTLTADWFSDQVGCPATLANDADLAAVGEAWFGAGRGLNDIIYVTISTGIGAGIVARNRLVRGAMSGAELGHVLMGSQQCCDDGSSTVENQGSGTALKRRAEAAGLNATAIELAQMVRQGDPKATMLWNDCLAAAGRGIASLCWILPPRAVVIGGGVGLNHDLVAPVISQQIETYGPAIRSIDILPAALGDDAAQAGAAAWMQANGNTRNTFIPAA